MRETVLLTPPRVLIANLQRFSAYGDKLHDPIEPSTSLELSEASTGTDVLYQLHAVVCHAGAQAIVGHYYVYVKGPNEQWYLLNDEDVSPVSEAEVKQDPGSYILFYVSDLPDTGPFLMYQNKDPLDQL